MFKLARTGPIGLDFGTDNIKMVQAELGGNTIKVRSAISLNYPSTRQDLLDSSYELKKLIQLARSQGGFKGGQTVVSMPPEKVQFVSLEYKRKSGQKADAAVIEAIKERFSDSLSSSVVDYLHIRPEHKEQQERTALVAVAERNTVIDFLEFLRKGGLNVDRLEIGPVAINRLIGAMDPTDRDRVVLVVNFGMRKSYATVLWGRRLLLDRELSFGLQTAIEHISDALEVSATEAEHLLERYGLQTNYHNRAGSNEPSIEETITDILKPSLRQLSTDLKRLMLYIASRTRGREVHHAYAFGSIVGWPGLEGALCELTGMPLHVSKPLFGLETSHQAAKIDGDPSLRGIAVATGLSMAGLV